ncbi:hypothetical protein LG293_17005 (plasmid) [Citricoccus nitrophenolicus]
MSKREWESGQIKLPSGEFAGLRKAIQDADEARRREAFQHTQAFWKALTRKQRTDGAAYDVAGRDWIQRQYADAQRTGWRPWGQGSPARDAEMDAKDLAHEMLGRVTRGGRHAPRRVLAADMEYPTNRTTEFSTGSGATIAFHRASNTVTWETDHNNHSVDHARATALGRTLFDRLKQVTWTRGTGGALTGNDEYHQDDDSFGGGANYSTESYGPLGAQDAPDNLIPYTDSQGRRFAAAGQMKPNRYTGMYERQVVEVDASGRPIPDSRKKPAATTPAAGTGGAQGRVSRGVRQGGQFAHTSRAEAGVSL